MSIHNTTWDNSTEVSIGGSDQQSREPVPAGQYPCVIIRSSYDETARDVIYNQDKSVVRPVYDYREQKETPMTPDERGRGCFVAKSGTYLWLLLRATLPNGDERLCPTQHHQRPASSQRGQSCVRCCAVCAGRWNRQPHRRTGHLRHARAPLPGQARPQGEEGLYR